MKICPQKWGFFFVLCTADFTAVKITLNHEIRVLSVLFGYPAMLIPVTPQNRLEFDLEGLGLIPVCILLWIIV